MREGQYNLTEFQKMFVKGSHDVLIGNREIWSKSLVFKGSFEHRGFFFFQTEDHEKSNMQEKRRKKKSWLWERGEHPLFAL